MQRLALLPPYAVLAGAICAIALGGCARRDAASEFRADAGGAPSAEALGARATLAASSVPSSPSYVGTDGGASAMAIGPLGGVVRVEGATLTIPARSLGRERVFRIARVTGAALADWPRGTETGFVFEPADERFRVPATIELPHAEGEGEVVCQNGPGERLMVQFEATPTKKLFPIHVVALPHRCAVYSAEHARALKAARRGDESRVQRENQSFHWELKGKVCDPSELVRPNAGKDLREPPGVGGCPAGMTPIHPRRPICIDRWEAHVVEILEDGTEHTWSPYFNPGTMRIRAKSAPGAIPQGYVSQLQAASACAAAGKRLCRDDEWITACRGVKNTQYPYGSEERRGTCNDHRDPHPAMQYLESRDLSVYTKLEHPCINQVPDSLLATGAKEACATPDGVADIVGNLHEWTADPNGHFRGGFYVDTWMNGHGCDYVTTAHEPRYWDYSTGFRCCADKRPADAGRER